MKVADVMTARVVTVDMHSTLQAAARLMLEAGVSGLPVVDPAGDLVGIVTEADFVDEELEHAWGQPHHRLVPVHGLRQSSPPGNVTVADVMTGDLVTAQPGEPVGQESPDVVDDGAWVPLTRVDRDNDRSVLPGSPNIARSMGAVPSAVDLFFLAFRNHYGLAKLELDISRPQAEFVASRVSALNQCYY